MTPRLSLSRSCRPWTVTTAAARAVTRAITTGVMALVVMAPVVCLQAATLSRQHAESFAHKVAIITGQGDVDPAPGVDARARDGSRRTTVSEDELNSWFAYRARPMLPDGIADPRMTLVGNDTVMGTAVVDLDAMGRTRTSGGLLDPWALVGGRVPVTVTGVLRTSDGSGRFVVEHAEISGVPVPMLLLEQLVSYYSRTPDDPDGIRLGEAFTLPANIQRIELGQGRAVVVQ